MKRKSTTKRLLSGKIANRKASCAVSKLRDKQKGKSRQLVSKSAKK